MMIARRKIIETARTWIGTPYHHQGRLKNVGVDCIGLILGVGEELGLVGFDREEYRTYGRTPPRGRGMLIHFDRDLGKRLDKWYPGDIVVFWINEITKRPQHIAILGDYYHDLSLIHTYSSMGRVVEHHFSEEWKSKLICAYKFPSEIEAWQPSH